jgi:hypothetical protein
MAAVAMLALSVPRLGIAPELAPGVRAAQEIDFAAYWRDVPSLPPILAEAPSPRKRIVARERPARMIDDALRQRALESVRMLAAQSPPV